MAMIGKVPSLRRRIRDEMDKMLVAMIGKVLSLRRQIRERRDVILVAMIWMVTIVYWSHSMMTQYGWWSAKRWKKKAHENCMGTEMEIV